MSVLAITLVLVPSGPVAADGPVSITGVDPTVAEPSETLVVTGAGFSAVAAENMVTINGRPLAVTSAASDRLEATVPADATSGKVSVSTSAGSATAADDTFIPPPPFAAADVGFAETVGTSSPATVALPVADRIGLLTFDAAAGSRASFKLSNGTFGSSSSTARVSVLRPDGSTLVPASGFGNAGLFIDPKTLGQAGTYTILIDPQGTATGQVDVQVYDVPEDVELEATAGGAAVTAATTVPGQNATVNFEGEAGTRAAVHLFNGTFGTSSSTARVSIVRPDGSTLVSSNGFGNAGLFIDPQALQQSGTYTILVDPQSAATGQVELRVYDVPANTTVEAITDGTPVTAVTTVPGQNATVTFDATADAKMAIQLSAGTFGPSSSNARVSLLRPDGTTLLPANGFSNTGLFIDRRTLDAAGTYTLLIDPQAAATGQVEVGVFEVPPDQAATAVPDGGTVTVATQVPGQNASVTFDATDGQRVSIELVSTSYPSNIKTSLIGPSGTTLVNPFNVGNSGAIFDHLVSATGTYTILLDPQGADLGSTELRVHLTPENRAEAVIDGDPVSVATSVPGQNASVTFEADAGQRISIELTGSTYGTSGAKVSLIAPDGSTLVTPTTMNSTLFLDTRVLPASGGYRLLIDPQDTRTGQVTALIHEVPGDSVATGNTTGDPVSVATTVPGQNAAVTFEATAGQRVSLELTGATFGSGGAKVSLLAPDDATVIAPTTLNTNLFLDARLLSVAGTFRLVVDPQGSKVGEVSARIHDVPADTTASAEVGGPQVTLETTAPGQNAEATFTGQAGQRVSIQLNDSTFGTSGAKVSLIAPGGSTIISPTSITTNLFLDARVLAESGTYRLVVDPQSANTGRVSARVHDVPPDVTETIHLGGDFREVEITAPGQKALITTDTLPAGTAVRLRVDDSLHDVPIRITGPDGQVIVPSWSADWPDDVLAFTAAAGVHTIGLDPAGASTGRWRLELYVGAGLPRVSAPETATGWFTTASPDISWSVDANPLPVGFAVLLDQAPTTVPEPVVTQTPRSLAGPLPEGERWLHVRAVLPDGTAGRTAHLRLRVDTIVPTLTSLSSSSHPEPDVVYPDDVLSVDMAGNDDPGASGFAGFSVHLDDTPFVGADATAEVTSSPWETQLPGDGDWWLAVRAVDVAGNASPAQVLHVQVDRSGPSAPLVSSSTHPDSAVAYQQEGVVASWTPAPNDEVTGWTYELNQVESTIPDPQVTTGEPRLAEDLTPGTWWLHVRGVDAQGRWSPTTHFKITIADRRQLASPRNGQTLFGTVALTPEIQCQVADSITYVKVTPVAGGTSPQVGPLRSASGACGFAWDTMQLQAGVRRFPDGEYDLTVVRLGLAIADPIRVAVDNSLTTLQRLEADYAAGLSTLDGFLNDVVTALLSPEALPARYQADDPLNAPNPLEYFLVIQENVGGLTAAQATALTERLTPTSAESSSAAGGAATTSTEIADCASDGLELAESIFQCAARSEHIVVGYNPDRIGPSDTDRPAPIQNILDDMEFARNYYQNLGFRVPDKTYVLLTQLVDVDDGFSPPRIDLSPLTQDTGPLPSTIFMNPGSGPDNAHLSAHEYFHQVVFSYIDFTDMLDWDWRWIDGPGPIQVPIRVPIEHEANWFWNEALSNWASHQVQQALPPSRQGVGFAARLDEFLAEPSARLTLNNGRDSGGREYGGFILGEHLQQRFGTGALVDLLETADQWGDVNLSEVYAELLGSKGSSFATEITHFWQSAYLMESQFGVGFTDEGAQDPAGSSDKLQGVWREVLRAHDSATPDGRADHLDIHVLDELQSSEGTAEIGAGGAAFFELHKPYYGGDANWTITTESENVRAFVISMADVDSLDACDFPVEMDINHEGPQLLGEAGLPINSVCPVSTLVVVNVGGPGDDSVDLNWRVRLAPSNATMSTSKIEIGFTEQGNLIDAVAAYPKPMLGLRLKGDADAEVLGWAIPGEGWGIGEPGDPYHSGGVSWNHGMDETTAVTFRRDSPTSITSEVVIQDEFIVEHHFHPSPNPYLIQIDVSIHTRSGNGPTPTDVYYRRVFDWDIPPDQFTEYSTIAVKPGEDAPYLAHASDDGFADPDPEEPRTMIDASGLFADVGPADNGALIELALGSFEDETYKEFTIYYGAAPTEEIALQALDTVPAQLYSLGQHNAGDGTPVTGIFAVDGSSLPSGAGPENATLSALEGDSPHEVLTVDRASEQAALRQEPEG